MARISRPHLLRATARGVSRHAVDGFPRPAKGGTRPSRRGLGALLLIVLLALLGLALPATAAEQSTDPLSLSAIGLQGGYFDLTLAPGETQNLTVSRANTGTADLTARTYRANAYSIVNGGFGADIRGSAAADTTAWLSYTDELVNLAVDQESLSTFAVTVPPGTLPGDYLSGIVLENETPVAAETTGSIAINQVVRHVLAVSIRVPGAYEPAFGFNDVKHRLTAGRSVVGVGIENTGNQNLKPAGPLTVHNLQHDVVVEAPVTMGSLYAHMNTRVESTFGGALNPGKYLLTMTLTDAVTGVSATITDAPFTVEAPAGDLGARFRATLPGIVQDALGGPLWPWILAAALLLMALILLIVFIRRRKRAALAAAESAAASAAESETEAPPQPDTSLDWLITATAPPTATQPPSPDPVRPRTEGTP